MKEWRHFYTNNFFKKRILYPSFTLSFMFSELWCEIRVNIIKEKNENENTKTFKIPLKGFKKKRNEMKFEL